MNSYEHTISVKVTPRRVYDALTKEMSNWWTDMTSKVDKIGDKTTAKFEDGTTWSFEVAKLEENTLVELFCFQADHIHPVTTPAMRTEWENTTLRFRIIENSENTTIHFTHVGLTPEVHCYDICNSGWNHFFGSSLKAYLENQSA